MLTLFPAALSLVTLVAVTDPQATHAASCAIESRPASIVRSIPPDYPQIAKDEGLTGHTLVRVVLDEQGHLTDAAVQKTSGSRVLDSAAVRAAKALTYAPEIDACRSVSGSYSVDIEFAG